MAYAYNAIDDLLRQQTPQKQDIFAGGTAQNQTQAAQGAQGDQAQGQAGALKTESQAVGGASGGSTYTGPQVRSSSADAGSPSGQTTANQAAYAAASAQPQQTPQAFSDVADQIKKQNDALTQQANSYTNSQQTDYSWDPQKFNKAIYQGDTGALTDLSGMINQKTPNPVTPMKVPDVSLPDAALLGTNAGLGQLISRGQGANYTPGMSAFDVQSLRTSPQFNQQIANLQKQYGNLQQSAIDLPGKAQTAVEGQNTVGLAARKGGIMDLLTQASTDITGKESAAAQGANAEVANQKKGLSQAESNKIYQANLPGVQDYLSKTNPDAAQYVQYVDPSKYLNFRGDVNSVITPEQAATFNRIHGLLGDTSSQVATTLDPNYTVDTSGLQKAIENQAIGRVPAKPVLNPVKLTQPPPPPPPPPVPLPPVIFPPNKIGVTPQGTPRGPLPGTLAIPSPGGDIPMDSGITIGVNQKMTDAQNVVANPVGGTFQIPGTLQGIIGQTVGQINQPQPDYSAWGGYISPSEIY